VLSQALQPHQRFQIWWIFKETVWGPVAARADRIQILGFQSFARAAFFNVVVADGLKKETF